MSVWKESSLTDLGTVERGRSRHRPRNDPQLFGKGVPFFQTADVKSATLHMTEATQEYSEFGVTQSRVWEPGITCITIAANIAESAVLGVRGCFPDSVLGFIPKEQADDSYFVKYLLDVHRARLTNAARGTTQDNLSLEKLLSHSFPVPEAAGRSRIAGILRSIDDLIENNRRRVEVLEEMARAIYREWFVHFRYPGHENVPVVDSPLGPIPHGWLAGSVSDLCLRIQAGSTPKRSEPSFWSDPEIAWYKTGDLKDSILLGSTERIASDAVLASKARIFQPDTILMAIYGSPTVGRLGLLEQPSSANQAALGMVADPERCSTEYLWFLLEGLREHLNGIAQGAAQQNVSKAKVASAPARIPPLSLVERFTEAASPIWRGAHVMSRQSARLTKLRDLLLPKLVTGQIDVSELDLDRSLEGVGA